MTPLPGLPPHEIAERLEAARAGDVRWRDGRAFSLVYLAGDEVLAVAEDAYRRYASENALNTEAFPSLRRFQQEVVGIVAGWVAAPDDAAGVMTSGGTESILLAVLGARERARAEGRSAAGNVVLATSAHAAFDKACHAFGVEARRIPVGADWRADAEAMAAAVDDDTVLLVASAPQYPQGVVDPVAEIAAIAAARGISCHVDACMGGVTLPHLARLGQQLPPWNMAVEGVTSISVDLHKYGYTAKGASVLLHRTKRLRSYHTFVTDAWLGGVYGSAGLLGTRGGGSIAAAWAVMHHLGDEGYLRLTAAARRACLALADHITAIPDLRLLAHPDTTLLAFTATDPERLDVYAVADALRRRGWYVDRQGPPASLHCTVNAVHDGLIDEFAVDLRDAVDEMRAAGHRGGAGAYGTVD